MKFLILVLAAVAVAEPDSDSKANLFVNGVPTTTAGFYNQHWGLNQYLNPAAIHYPNQYVYPSQYVYNPHRVYKRDAEAEADPQFFHNQAYPNYGYQTVGSVAVAGEPVFKQGTFHTNYRNVATGAQQVPYTGETPQVYQTVQQQQVVHPFVRRFFKRDADSDSDADAVTYFTTQQYPYFGVQAGVNRQVYSAADPSVYYGNAATTYNGFAVNPLNAYPAVYQYTY